MPSHKKHPIFISVIANDEEVLCINPLELSSFQILEKAKIKVKPKSSNDADVVVAPTIRFFFPSGTGLSYSVGIDITRQHFDYLCATLLEFRYLNQFEFEAKSKAISQEKMDEWNKISEDNSTKLPTETVTGT